jgi:hypothetical protein
MAAAGPPFRERHWRRTMKAFLTYFVVISLIVPGAPISAAMTMQSNTVASTSRQLPAAAAPDGGWPRSYMTPSGGGVVVYEPQVASWVDQKQIVMYAAVAYTTSDARSALGTIMVKADTKIAVPERLVSFSDLQIEMANFPTLSREQLEKVVSEIKSAIPLEDRVIGLDRVLAAVDTSQIHARNVEGVKADPPPIFFSQRPAVLVNVDGDPIWGPIPGNNLRFAVNTNWDLFEDGSSKTYYLRTDQGWMKASNLEGPWTPAERLPESFVKLPADDNWKDARAALPPQKIGASTQVPVVYVSKVPAELILLRGMPAYVAVNGTKLSWVSNTESDIFRMGTDGPVYFLVSGRWFSAPGFSGPWTFATPTLPDDFKRIPLEHQRSRVLASVPGTTQALEAVLLAQVPQTARVSRTAVKAPDVTYQGEPQFEAIATTMVARAVNTDKDILKVGDLYYLCFEGVWFVAKEPTGPWTVADSIPTHIYEIPISSPAYNVTHVTIEDSDDEWVEFATAAAYSGMMVAWGCAVWGTGYYYPPYFWGGGYYPAYYPRYPSYGYGARYNPWTGAYSRAGAVYGPYGGAGYGARYNPRTGTYSRGAAAFGPGGARGAAEAWNPRTGTYAQTRQGRNVYGSWGATGVQRGDQWAATARATNRATGTTNRVTQGSGGGTAVSRSGPGGRTTIGTSGSGNVYAGRDGNVYRNQGGGWQKHDNGGWTNFDRPTGTSGQLSDRPNQGAISSTTTGQLNRDRSVRSDGAQRTRDLGSVRSSGSGGARAGSYRPSGGGFRGGGFRGGGRR